MNFAQVSLLLVLLVIIAAGVYYWFFMRKKGNGGGGGGGGGGDYVLACPSGVGGGSGGPPTPAPGSTFKGINSACPCSPTTLLNSGLCGGLLTDMSKYPDATMMFSIYNNCSKPMYISSTKDNSGSRASLFSLLTIPGNTLMRIPIKDPSISAGAMWATYNKDDLTANASNPASEPDTTSVTKIEFTITKNPDGTWTNGGNISYVEGVMHPALIYFGPGAMQEVDKNPGENNKLSYTTCSEEQLMKDCPTVVNSKNMCIAPDFFCQTAYNTNPNWSAMCDDNTGAMSSYIKAFGLDNIDVNLYMNKDDKTLSTVSRFIYNNGNPLNKASDLTPYRLASYYWPKSGTTGTSYTFTSDEEKQLFVGTVSDGKIVGGDNTIQTPGSRITAFNSVMNGWAMARGMCDPSDVLNNCGGQNGDYMAMYQNPSSAANTNNFTKVDTNLSSNTSQWHTGKFPDNKYAKYVTEHTHYIYGFPYDEGPYGGYTSSVQSDPPQMCIVFCPTCTKIDDMISGKPVIVQNV
jgi:hypothetical protein